MGNFDYNNNNNNCNNNWNNRKKYNFRPPKSQDNNGRSYGSQLPSWEKKFCNTVGLPWQKVIENQKYISHDDKILKWNDTAAKEAFWNAKNRFWAEIHGQPCDIKLPDPDSFIDQIDWESTDVDHDLISDISEDHDIDQGVVIGFPVVQEQYVPTPTGWGDIEEDSGNKKNEPNIPKNGDNTGLVGQYVPTPTGWGDPEEPDIPKKDVPAPTGWGDVEGWDPQSKNGQTMYDNRQQWDYGYKKNVCGYKDASWNTSRYKVKRYNHHSNNHYDYYHGDRRGNFGYGHPLVEWKPVRRGW